MVGLLHDVGKLLIEQYMPIYFHSVVDAAIEKKNPIDAEHGLLSFDHADLGAFIAEQSGLSEDVTRVTAFHHRPHKFVHRNRELLDVLILANYFASRHGVSSLGAPDEFAPPDDLVLRGLGLRSDQLADIWAQLKPTLEAADELASI
jgi:HD-like signal output (HDOD) protein